MARAHGSSSYPWCKLPLLAVTPSVRRVAPASRNSKARYAGLRFFAAPLFDSGEPSSGVRWPGTAVDIHHVTDGVARVFVVFDFPPDPSIGQGELKVPPGQLLDPGDGRADGAVLGPGIAVEAVGAAAAGFRSVRWPAGPGARRCGRSRRAVASRCRWRRGATARARWSPRWGNIARQVADPGSAGCSTPGSLECAKRCGM